VKDYGEGGRGASGKGTIVLTYFGERDNLVLKYESRPKVREKEPE
jgi:hypothetical protein